MSVEMPFTAAHITSIAARAAELEQIGEDRQDPLRWLAAAARQMRVGDDGDPHRYCAGSIR